jgi:predicted O-methyltransferase YrrM
MPRVLTYTPPGWAEAPQRVVLATPSYGGLTPEYARSLYATAHVLGHAGYPAALYLMAGNCHIDDARNRTVRDFLSGPGTDLVFMDADQGWSGEEVARLLAYDRDVVGGVPRHKHAEETYPVLPLPQAQAAPDGLLEVASIGTGLLRIRRAVLERLAAAADSYREHEEPDGPAVPVIFERQIARGKRVSGDYVFCAKWRAVGGSLWFDPEMHISHVGETVWPGCFGAHARRRNGTTLRQILLAVRENVANEALMAELAEWWGNPEFALHPAQLMVLADLARQAEGPIIEGGSGLSTLVMAAAAPTQPVWALEHDTAWLGRLMRAARKAGLENITLCEAPLEGPAGAQGYAVPDALPRTCALLVVDGPPRDGNPVGRGKAMALLPRLQPDGALFLDDAQDSAAVAAWERALGAPLHVFQAPRPFAVARLPGKTEQGAA